MRSLQGRDTRFIGCHTYILANYDRTRACVHAPRFSATFKSASYIRRTVHDCGRSTGTYSKLAVSRLHAQLTAILEWSIDAYGSKIYLHSLDY